MAMRYRSGWWLEQKYHSEGLTQAEIADECGVSPRCIRKWMTKRGIETRNVVGENHPLTGKTRATETKSKISESLTGREFSDAHRDNLAASAAGRRLAESTKEKISDSLSGTDRSEMVRRRMGKSTAGERNPNWKGGYARRYGSGWTAAKQHVHQRDRRCQQCGHDGAERQLEVHHVIPVRRFRGSSEASLGDAHDPSNLVLLCRRCHPKADHGLLGFESGIDPPE